MAMGSGLLALAMLLAADGPSCPPDGATTFQVRVLTMDGLDWRTSSYSRLQPVARQGTSTIWTADRSLATALAERARSTSFSGKVVSTDDVTLTRTETINYVAAVDRYADGPINQSSAIAFMPKPERLDERFAVKLCGRKLDQGILTQVALEETHIDVIHGVPQTESLMPSHDQDDPGNDRGRAGHRQRGDGADPRESTQSITCSVQVPEISQAKVSGEWLIPNNGVLLVSLGVKTVADDQGKAVVRERIAVIEACASSMPMPSPGASVGAVSAAPTPYAKLAMPAVPARSLPVPIDPNGDIVEGDLPPLPEALASTDLDRIKPAPYLPSPQAPIIPGADRDTQLARTSYGPVPSAEKMEPDVENDRDESRRAFFEKVLDALGKAGVNIDIDTDGTTPVLRSPKPSCDKCDGDDSFCPAGARPAEVPGGLKFAPEISGQARHLGEVRRWRPGYRARRQPERCPQGSRPDRDHPDPARRQGRPGNQDHRRPGRSREVQDHSQEARALDDPTLKRDPPNLRGGPTHFGESARPLFSFSESGILPESVSTTPSAQEYIRGRWRKSRNGHPSRAKVERRSPSDPEPG